MHSATPDGDQGVSIPTTVRAGEGTDSAVGTRFCDRFLIIAMLSHLPISRANRRQPACLVSTLKM